MISVVYAHPYPRYSRACAALLHAVEGMPDLEVRSLYDRYPDFDIDTAAERSALEKARLVVWMHPLYWYTAPALLKHWFDEVLVKGWAYGDGGTALAGKDCLWVTTTGGDEKAYSPEGRHGHPIETFAPVIERTARYCAMNWLDPFVVHGAHQVSEEALREAGAALRRRLETWSAKGVSSANERG
jgi:glutathione-regulated potassium-efflux system ancillary protein KefF